MSSEKMPSASVTAKPNIEAAELAIGSRRVAQSAGQVAAEDVAEAEGRAGDDRNKPDRRRCNELLPLPC
jgi:hypothetical protein